MFENIIIIVGIVVCFLPAVYLKKEEREMFKKLIVVAALASIISSSALADCDASFVKKQFAETNFSKINTSKKNGKIQDVAYAESVGGVLTKTNGSLQNNIQNLQIPTGTISISKDWSNIIYSIDDYIKNAPTNEDVFIRTAMLASVIFEDSDITPIWASSLLSEYGAPAVGFSNLIKSIKDKGAYQNAMRKFIIFSSIADKNSDDSFARKLFAKDKKHWECVEKSLKGAL